MDGNRKKKSLECNRKVMNKWKTPVELRNGSKLLRSRWTDIKKRFSPGDTYSPVGFCCTEIPVMILLEKSDGYKTRIRDEKEIKLAQSLFIEDLESHQQNHQKLKMANEILVQASMNI